MSDYTVTLLPPPYPTRLFPSRCPHAPQFVMTAGVRLGSGRKPMEIDHSVCLACGAPRPATYGGNVFVDLHMLWEELGWHAEIGARIIEVRGRWARIARKLFGPAGWNGRHERIARLIDPKLSMTLEVHQTGRFENGRELLIGQVTSFDPSYVREASHA